MTSFFESLAVQAVLPGFAKEEGPQLPPELILSILQHLHPSDDDSTKALCTCATVSSWWNRIATAALYVHIRIPSLWSARAFARTLTSNSGNLGPLVKSVHVYGKRIHADEMNEFREHDKRRKSFKAKLRSVFAHVALPERRGWFVVTLAQQCNQLRELSLMAYCHAIDIDLAAAVAHSSKMASFAARLTRLHFDALDGHRASSARWILDDFSRTTETSRSILPSLETLEMNHLLVDGSLAEWRPLPSCRAIYLRHLETHTAGILRLMESARTSLVRLHLTDLLIYEDAATQLPILPKLRILEIERVEFVNPGDFVSLLSAGSETLEHLALQGRFLSFLATYIFKRLSLATLPELPRLRILKLTCLPSHVVAHGYLSALCKQAPALRSLSLTGLTSTHSGELLTALSDVAEKGRLTALSLVDLTWFFSPNSKTYCDQSLEHSLSLGNVLSRLHTVTELRMRYSSEGRIPSSRFYTQLPPQLERLSIFPFAHAWPLVLHENIQGVSLQARYPQLKALCLSGYAEGSDEQENVYRVFRRRCSAAGITLEELESTQPFM